MLIENTMFGGKRNKIDIAIQRLREFEPREGYYLAFSGGKDSVTVERLAKMAGVRFDAHYHITTVDPPELVRFIKAHYPDVARERPEMSMFRLILHKQWPPMRTQRYCCEWLKESGGDGRFVVQGTRWAESPRRRQKRKMTELCSSRSMRTLNPIIDWEDSDVWQFIRQEQIPYCSLYDEGFDRLGCILCPIGGNPKREATRWPQFKAAYIRTFDRLLEVRQAVGKTTRFATGAELYKWWIQRNTRKRPPKEQLPLPIS